MSIIERERKELNIQLNDDENEQERCFIEQALTLLNERERIIFNKIKNNVNVDNKSIRDNTMVPVETQYFTNDYTTEYCIDPFDNNSSDNRKRFESTSSTGLGSEDFNSNSVNSDTLLEISVTAESNDSNTTKNYYFYQGILIYKHYYVFFMMIFFY